MKIYVAGRTTNFEVVRDVQNLCRRIGHEITFDWTRAIEDKDWVDENNLDLSDGFKRTCAINDRRGVRDADTVIMIAGKGLCGTLIEAGMALAANKRLWILGKPERDSVFFRLPEVSMFNGFYTLHTALTRDYTTHPIENDEEGE